MEKTKCGVMDCDNDAVCEGVEDGFPCCHDHCSHDGEGSEACNYTQNPFREG